MMWSGSWDGWDLLWMTIVMVAFWGGLFWLVANAVRRPSPPEMTSRPRSAIEILEERFARGEIDEDEYHERRRILESKAA